LPRSRNTTEIVSGFRNSSGTSTPRRPSSPCATRPRCGHPDGHPRAEPAWSQATRARGSARAVGNRGSAQYQP